MMITAEKNEAATLSPPRSSGQPAVAPALPVQPGWEAAPAPVRRRPMARKGLRPVRRAQDFGWRSPEAAAVVVASFCVSLACFYVAAYARVTAEGFEAARVRAAMKQAAFDKEALQADISRLTLPATVQARAAQMGMVRATSQTVRMVTPPPAASTTDTTNAPASALTQ